MLFRRSDIPTRREINPLPSALCKRISRYPETARVFPSGEKARALMTGGWKYTGGRSKEISTFRSGSVSFFAPASIHEEIEAMCFWGSGPPHQRIQGVV